ncbi:MAG TPA: hypothetical protein VFA94_12260 [Acidimicrobiales bacterium]|nr:hypothetical protein [Acidimicrobiales bacterium]
MSDGNEIDVIQNLLIFGVEVEGDELRVDIYSGADCVCGTLIYTFTDETERAERAALLGRWRDRSTPVTYVRRDGSAALMDELALLADALDG